MAIPKEEMAALALRAHSKKSTITLWDLAVIAAVLLASVTLFVFSAAALDGKASYCVIEIDGEEFARYNILALAEPKTIEIDNDYGKNIIVIDSEGAKVVFTDCPDGHELKEGKITFAGQSLICLPHRLCIRLEGKSENSAVSW